MPESLYALPRLGDISLANNRVTGPLKEKWFDGDDSLPSLFQLDLDSNDMTGTIPATLWSRPVMRFVYLNNNRLTGTVFNGTLDKVSPYLEMIWLQENKELMGPLPSWLFTHSLLNTFWADGNKFTGSLPPVDASGLVPALQWLGLENNRLTGPIQSSHLAGYSLQTVHLNGNALTGPLPVMDTNFIWPLQVLWLHNNQLSGPIPADFGLGWTGLWDLRLTGNADLTGEITETQCRTWLSSCNEGVRYEVDCPPVVCTGGCCTNAACIPSLI